MKNQLETLNALSKIIDLDLFYAVTIYKNEISLQGFKDKLESVGEVFQMPTELNEDGWYQEKNLFMDTIVRITLT